MKMCKEFKKSNLSLRCETEVTALIGIVELKWEREMREERRVDKMAGDCEYVFISIFSVGERDDWEILVNCLRK